MCVCMHAFVRERNYVCVCLCVCVPTYFRTREFKAYLYFVKKINENILHFTELTIQVTFTRTHTHTHAHTRTHTHNSDPPHIYSNKLELPFTYTHPMIYGRRTGQTENIQTHIYIYIHVQIYIHTCVYICVQTERERWREIEREIRAVSKSLKHPAGPGRKLILCRYTEW